MNIKSRLDKLSKHQALAIPTFCECFDKHNEASLNKVYGESFNHSDILPDGTPLSGICRRCQRPINSNVEKFQSTLIEIYG